MPLTLRKKPEDTGTFTCHDDSQRARVALGARFFSSFSQTQPANVLWRQPHPLLALHVARSTYSDSHWIAGCEESKTHPRRWRAYIQRLENGATPDENAIYRLEIQNDFTFLCDPENIMDHLPDSAFGVLLGLAVGITEVRNLMGDPRNHVSAPDAPRSDWRAPRFSFAMQTAIGSPFVERWGFAIQESVIQNKRFRVWIEQQRNGREMHLLLRDDGSIEGMHDLEALPAAIHGVGLGLLMGLDYAATGPHEAPEMGLVVSAEG